MKLIKSTFLFIVLTTAIIACSPKGESVETSEAKKVASAAEAVSYSLNTDKSLVTWIGSKPAGKHNGTINISGGTLKMNGNEIVAGNFTIDITSLKDLDMAGTDDAAKLQGHLMSADFFDAANFPEASFEITSIAGFSSAKLNVDKAEYATENTPASQSEILVNNPTHFISGNLTMRGTTKNITFPANVSVTDGLVKALANFNINRTDWGLMYGDEASAVDKAKDQFIYNTVTIGLVIEASTQERASL